MTEQEKFNAEVQIRLTRQDAKFELFMHELQQQREDIRRLQDRQDADRKVLENKFDGLSNQIHNLTIAAVVGFGAIALAVGGLVVAALK